MLVLPIKKKWFDMILSGEKKEEYREIKPYYDSRLNKKLNFCESTGYGPDVQICSHCGHKVYRNDRIKFKEILSKCIKVKEVQNG